MARPRKDEKREYIRALREKGLTYRQIMKETGYMQNEIWYYLKDVKEKQPVDNVQNTA